MNKLTGIAPGTPVHDARRTTNGGLIPSAIFSPLNFEDAMSGVEAGAANLVQPQTAGDADKEVGNPSGRGLHKGKSRKESSASLPLDSTASFLPQAVPVHYRTHDEVEAVQAEQLLGEVSVKLNATVEEPLRAAPLVVGRNDASSGSLLPAMLPVDHRLLTKGLPGGSDPVRSERAVLAGGVQPESDSPLVTSVQVPEVVDRALISPMPSTRLVVVEPIVPSRSEPGSPATGLSAKEESAGKPPMWVPSVKISNLQIEVRPEPTLKPFAPAPALTPAASSVVSTVHLTRGFGAEAYQLSSKFEDQVKVPKAVPPANSIQWEASQSAMLIQSQGQLAQLTKALPAVGQRNPLLPAVLMKSSEVLRDTAAAFDSSHASLLVMNEASRMHFPGKHLEGEAAPSMNGAPLLKDDIKNESSEQRVDSTGMHLMATPHVVYSDGIKELGSSGSALDGQLLNQIADQARAALEGGLQTASFQLDDSMGPLQIRIEVTGTQAAVHFISDVSGQRELLGAQVGDLAQRLQDHGLQLSGAYFSNAGGQPDGFREQRRQDEANQTKGARKVGDVDLRELSVPTPSQGKRVLRSTNMVDYFA